MDLIILVYILAILLSFFVAGVLLGALFYRPLRTKVVKFLRIEHLFLDKSFLNPVLRPGTHPWTAEAVLNPAAIDLDGRIHLLYRAIGMDGVSRIGYASSEDGIIFDEQLPYPAFIGRSPRRLAMHQRRYSPTLYPSGGSWGGCEDPRMVLIDGRIYVTFNMFDGWDFVRVAVIDIAKEDFLAHRFDRWDGPHIISKPGQVHKNWVLFPEKINGKFAILNSVTPKIDIAYRDSIENIGVTEPLVESWVGARSSLPERDGVWDSFVRSAGPPPVKTKHGWLLFYHAQDKRDPGRYKLGVMLLDLHDPTKVLKRSIVPVLAPDANYENEGKPGVVYACGAVVRGNTLYLYYGGADKVVCVATEDFNKFLDALVHESQPAITHGSKVHTV